MTEGPQLGTDWAQCPQHSVVSPARCHGTWSPRHRLPSLVPWHGVPRRGVPSPVPWHGVPGTSQGPWHSLGATSPAWCHAMGSLAQLGHSVPSPVPWHRVPRHGVPSPVPWHRVPRRGVPSPVPWHSIPGHSVPKPVPQHRIPSTAWAQHPQHAATSQCPQPNTGHHVPKPGRGVPSPGLTCPLRVSLTAADLIGAVGTVGFAVALVAGTDAAPARHAPKLCRPARRTGRFGGCSGDGDTCQPGSCHRACPPTWPHTHGNRSRRSRPRNHSRRRNAKA